MSEAVQIIPRNEYKPELELKVEYYLSIIPKSEKNTKKFYRTKEIETRDEHERFLWEKEEIRRIREGHFGLSGKAYFFYNYVLMSNIDDGLIRPTFRASQNKWFDELTRCDSSKDGWGLICVKRRRAGFSWMEAADVLHDAMTKPHRQFGMTSKTEQDAIELFKKVVAIYDNLPLFLRPTVASKTAKSILFGIKTKDATGNNILKGHRSEIVLRAPTDISFEGYALKKLVLDEGGKVSNLRNIFSAAEATMLQGTKRLGTPVVFGCVCAGTKVWDKHGNLVNVEDLKQEDGILGYDGNGVSVETIPWMQPPAEKECVRITTNSGRYLECSTDHPILWSKRHFGINEELPKINGKRRRRKIKTTIFKEAHELKVGDQIAVIESVPVFGNLEMWEPRLIGWLIGDGSYGKDSTPVLSNCDADIVSYVEKHFNPRISRQRITKDGRLYKEMAIRGICPKLREIGIYGQTKLAKTLPKNIHLYRKQDICELLGGLYDTDGYVANMRSTKNINLASTSFDLLMEVKLLLQKLGIHGGIYRIKKSEKNIKDKNDHFRLTVSDRDSVINFHKNISLKVKTKQNNLNEIVKTLSKRGRRFANYDQHVKGLRFEIVKSVTPIGLKPIYNLEAGNTHTYIANGIVTHNTAGDVGKEGKELMEMWHNSDVYKLKKFFYGGWMGLDELVDEYGNDNEEEAIRWITYERYRKESLSTKEYIDFIQQFPLTVQEAFTANTDTGLGNRVKLEKQRNSLLENPVQKKKGYFMLDKDGKPVFVASPRGACIIYEEPEPQYRDLYLAGQDPTDHTTSAKDASSLSMFIMKKQHGSTPPKIVFEYTDRPNIPRDYYEQALCALMYYNDCKVMIERNKIGVITYFEERGAKHLIATSPQGLNRLIASQTYNLGYYKTKATTQYGEELIADYVENHYELIPSIELIEELQNYGLKNTDRVDALMAALIYLKDDKSIAREKKTVGGAPRFSYKFVNGILQKVYV